MRYFASTAVLVVDAAVGVAAVAVVVVAVVAVVVAAVVVVEAVVVDSVAVDAVVGADAVGADIVDVAVVATEIQQMVYYNLHCKSEGCVQTWPSCSLHMVEVLCPYAKY